MFEDKEKSLEVSEKLLNDNEWHTIKLTCLQGKPIDLVLDGKKQELDLGERTQYPDFCQIGFGYGNATTFTGEIKSFKFWNRPLKRFKLIDELYALNQ